MSKRNDSPSAGAKRGRLLYHGQGLQPNLVAPALPSSFSSPPLLEPFPPSSPDTGPVLPRPFSFLEDRAGATFSYFLSNPDVHYYCIQGEWLPFDSSEHAWDEDPQGRPFSFSKSSPDIRYFYADGAWAKYDSAHYTWYTDRFGDPKYFDNRRWCRVPGPRGDEQWLRVGPDADSAATLPVGDWGPPREDEW